MPRNLFNNKLAYRLTTVFAPSDVGLFAIYPDSDISFHSYWDTCREQFAKKFKRDSFGFFMSVQADYPTAAPEFINFCENILEIKTKTKFFLTECKNAIFIQSSPFWKKCYMRRSLFTLLCRQGIFYNIGAKFEDVLFGNIDDLNIKKIDACYEFARRTKIACKRFFTGYNHYVGSGPDYNEYFPEKHGWVEEFKDKQLNYVKEVLVADVNSDLRIKFFGNSICLS